jgi:DNA-binding MarR family transcriptional regulator
MVECPRVTSRQSNIGEGNMQGLLETTGIQHPCDLDLLVFFHRHPRVLLTSEQLAARVGYDLKQVARSLDLLIERGLLSRGLNPSRVPRVYFFRAGDGEDVVERILRLGLTPDGRRELIRLLGERASRAAAVQGPANRDAVADGQGGVR